jgi:arylsulfatase A-like enzyme
MPPQDILLVVTTQWRARSCGYAGASDVVTPTLDRLAARGLDYAEAVTPHPFGPFARAALLTGLPSPANGLRTYWDALPATTPTLAHRMAACGYETAFFGKWGVGQRDPALPLVSVAAAQVIVAPGARGGFAPWVGFEGGFQLNDPWLHGDGLGDGCSAVRHTGYQSEVLCALAAAWLRRAPATLPRRPRFVFLSLEAPHPPYAAPTPPGTPSFAPDALELPPEVPRLPAIEGRARRELAGYYAHIAATDAALGRLLAAAPEALVAVTSVHGDMHGAHGLFRKGWPHEDSVRVPFVVRGAPGETAPRRSREPVSLLDLPAMLEHWARGQAWRCPREHAEISMPCVVPFADQCDRAWSGKRFPGGAKIIHTADGRPWPLDEPVVSPP